MIDWELIRYATNTDNKPTPGYAFNDLITNIRENPQGVPDVAAYLAECVAGDHAHVKLKALLCMKHLANRVPPFRIQLRSYAAVIEQATQFTGPPSPTYGDEPYRLVRDTATAVWDITFNQGDDIDNATQSLQKRIQGFGSAPTGNTNGPSAASTVLHGAADYVGDAIYDVVLDYREKGAVGTLRDATLDAADLVADGLETAAGWMRDMLAGSPPPPPPPRALTGGPANITLPPNMAICDQQPITSTGGFLEQYRQQNGRQFATMLERSGEDTESESPPSSGSGPRALGPGIDVMIDGRGPANVISMDRTLNPPLIVVRLTKSGSRVVVDEEKCHVMNDIAPAEIGSSSAANSEDLLDVGADDKSIEGVVGNGFKAVPMVEMTPAGKLLDKAHTISSEGRDDAAGGSEVNTPAATAVSGGSDDLLGLQDDHEELFHDPTLNASLKKAEANI
ncbi:hypothetical protein Pmar_PMAR001971 [Perkinsus marinus ATCC 50983]|uniref:ENTH domain-containing protein n=1 Tax=Perkinsus marinus (strain ATCC 50983 / TXsc) TaxID=423536 RepID=C5LYB8_PERM5|nr:hypothetical protein Pmar_PMAR001971 [Perkinsus marinus ATCC 50983]EEQ98156.1 hypothetical protein Pmar_PMAR001971 [Perkinsus marinus ATCC 50983]|eukprot:XP_002765439.1 hypothetical protein Pmar_PMAR001971 [Perkinsus marinus ATCC 50983]